MADAETEAVLQQLNLQRSALADFGLFAFQCDDIDRLLLRASELISAAIDVHLVKVLEHIPQQGKMLIRSGVGWQRGVVGRETLGDDVRSPGGYALKAGRPIVSRDVNVEDRFDIPEVLRRHGVQSMVNVIIAGEGGAFGVLEVDAQEPRDFSDNDVAFLRTYANLLAAAIERVRIHHELLKSAREQSILARELEHRVRNLLGLVSALATQTSTRDRTADEYRSAFVDRLHALAAAESLVFESGEGQTDLLALANRALAPYLQEDRKTVIIEGSSIRLSARQTRMFGLALHELATNAAKHGALSVGGGTVRVQWHLEQSSEDRSYLAVTWQEADGHEITPPERKGFGTRLLEDVISHELNGRAELMYEPTGLRYHLRFPVEVSGT